ncbi:cytochrome b/b6 domain-containing protein [Kaarinaea lacus]
MAYLRQRQSPTIRLLHITVLSFVLVQIVLSNLMDFTDAGEISNKPVEYFGTWAHILSGIILLPIALSFVVVELKLHGLRYFFPYLWGNVVELKRDIAQLKQLHLPELKPGGIAAIVQGLGMGALCLVLLTGLIWFSSWVYDAKWANTFRELHESLTGVIEFYLVGHGAMGVLHIWLVTRNEANQ